MDRVGDLVDGLLGVAGSFVGFAFSMKFFVVGDISGDLLGFAFDLVTMFTQGVLRSEGCDF